MTEREQRELRRLEENVLRLGELVQRQSEVIRQLKDKLDASQLALVEMRQRLDEAEQSERNASLAVALSGVSTSGDGQGREVWASDFIASLIKEIECCIGQLRAER